jgi:hypothetical protein
MRTLAIALIAVTPAMLGGCASVIKGSSQPIAISTPPVTGATCVLTSSRGSWTVTTPGSVEVKRSKDDIEIHCDKPGYQPAVKIIPSGLEETAAADMLLSDFTVIGAGVDAATGAMNQYPHTFEVPMRPASPGARLVAPPVAPPAAAAPNSQPKPAS